MTKTLTVSELTRRVREILEGQIGEVWVEGEISNYRKQSSGHHYFTLKDDGAHLACVMFARSYGAQSRMALADGMQIQAYGRVTVYEARGQYQLIVELVQTKGRGLLQARFEALKRKLEGEGLFEPSRKRSLPRFPRRVALITSPTGAAVQDMLNILGRRSPWLRILICPVRVQGEGAAEEIAETIRHLNMNRKRLRLDVLIVGRGGGSLEDLWEFNEEAVARAIYDSVLPVISAVGHEIDFTIADFVADLRAPTPSAAAELVTQDFESLSSELRSLRVALDRLVRQNLEVQKIKLQHLAAAAFFLEPQRILRESQQRVDQFESRLVQLRMAAFDQYRAHLFRLQSLLAAYRPANVLGARRREIAGFAVRIRNATFQTLDHWQRRTSSLEKMLQLLGPQQTLERGYTVTTDAKGTLLSSRTQVRSCDRLRTRFHDGEISSVVEGER
jgi:exodeoxyribonuclease VII large subunit